MGLFRRTPKGRHALGAAVTSIPSGPLRAAAPLAAALQAPVAPPAPAAEPSPEPSVMSSIAELIASGDAWASDLEDFHALHTPVLPEPMAEPVHALLPTAPAVLPPVVTQEPSARTSLEAALADLLPQQDDPVPSAPPTAPRVQLGFRDGTSASLDPDSEQALALELLAQSLTRRD